MRKILDLGCGKGNLSNYLSLKNKNAIIYGIDLSEININYCNKHKNNKNQIFKLSKAEKLSFKDNFFDEIHCYEVLEHVNDLNKTLKEIYRVLKNNAIIYLSVPNSQSEFSLLKSNPNYAKQVGHKRFFSKLELIKLFSKNKFILKKHYYSNSIEHFYWKFLFFFNYSIINQNGDTDKKPPYILNLINKILRKEIITDYKYEKNKFKKIIFFTFIIFYPLGRLIDLFFINKKQNAIFKKNEKS
jgi:ubiquinone/menaquinone biosynthesis C-methylase UbiE